MHAVLIVLLIGQTPRDIARPAVTVSNAVMIPAEGYESLEFRITNNTAQAITGYGVQIEVTWTDGKTTREGLGMLGPLDEDDPRGGSIPARAAGSARHPWARPGDYPPREVVVTLQWAIFADGSFVGDPAGVKDAFASRERQYRQEVFVLKALRAAQQAGTGLEALRAALRNVEEAPEEMNAALTHVRGNLQRALNGQVTIAPDVYLFNLIRSAEERRDRFDAHRRPRGGG